MHRDMAIEFASLVNQMALRPYPLPGGGSTPERLRRLTVLARNSSVSLARLVEAHTDALAILAEAGTPGIAGGLYGVWASQAPGGGVVLDSDRMTMTGHMPFASGLGIVNRAICTVRTASSESALLDIDVRPGPTVHVNTASWAAVGLQATATGSVDFIDHPVLEESVVGRGDWYLTRSGFWHGACAPAACWAGAALGLLDYAEGQPCEDPHRLAYLGVMRTAEFSLKSVLAQAGAEIDLHPNDLAAAKYRALSVRSAVERMCTLLADAFGQSLGPRPQANNSGVDQRIADLHLYLRQHHGNKDLAALGALVR